MTSPFLVQEQLLARPPAPIPERLAIYGAGGSGRRIARRLRQNGIKVAAFLDRRARANQSLDEVPVLAPLDGVRAFGGIAVVLAIHNPGDDLSQLRAQLREMGYGPIITLTDLCNTWPEDYSDFFWVAPSTTYLSQWPQIRAAYGLLANDGSRELFLKLLQFRLQGDHSECPQPEARQYFPSTLPPWSKHIRLIDCGAFTGDTLEALLGTGYEVQEAVCFEPDPSNYSRLVDCVRRHGIDALCLPCAVSNRTSQLSFSAESAGSSHLTSAGTVIVQAVALDDALPAFHPNLIKMDVEGAEPEALNGAKRMIERERPGLAVSIYHRADHLWQIPLQIAELLPDSSLSIRVHAHSSFDVVLYARPDITRRA